MVKKEGINKNENKLKYRKIYNKQQRRVQKQAHT